MMAWLYYFLSTFNYKLPFMGQTISYIETLIAYKDKNPCRYLAILCIHFAGEVPQVTKHQREFVRRRRVDQADQRTSERGQDYSDIGQKWRPPGEIPLPGEWLHGECCWWVVITYPCVTNTVKLICLLWLFQFNDLFLLCQSIPIGIKHQYRVKAMLEIDGMTVLEGHNLETPNTFCVNSRKMALELHTR